MNDLYGITRREFGISELDMSSYKFDKADWLKNHKGEVLIFDSEDEARGYISYIKELAFDLSTNAMRNL